MTGVMLITNEGIPLQTTVDSDTTVQVSPVIIIMVIIINIILPVRRPGVSAVQQN